MHYFFLKQLREFTQHPSNGKVFFLCTATYITFLFLPNSYIYITYTNVHSLWISLIIIKLPHSTKFIQYSTVASLHHGIQPYAHITNTSVHHNAIIVSSTVVHSHVGNYFYGLLGIFPHNYKSCFLSTFKCGLITTLFSQDKLIWMNYSIIQDDWDQNSTEIGYRITMNFSWMTTQLG